LKTYTTRFPNRPAHKFIENRSEILLEIEHVDFLPFRYPSYAHCTILLCKITIVFFYLDLKGMYRILVWRGNLLAANATHAYKWCGCHRSVFITRYAEVFEIFNSQATSLMLSIPSSKASKIASSFSTVRTVLLVASPISLLFGK
jgi:hypothetical protein